MKKTYITAVLIAFAVLLAGCISDSREQMVEGIKRQLKGTGAPGPETDYSGLDESWDETGRKAGNLFDDLSALARKAGSDIGGSLNEAAEGLGSALGSDLGGAFSGNVEDDTAPDVPGVRLEGPLHILKVVDGDTVKLKETGSDVRYRLIGIDTPESVAGEEYLESSGKENTAEGRDASAFMKEYLPKGTTVYIERDAETEDRYGRQLVYLYAEKDGDTVFINELLLKEGYARLLTMQPNVRYADNVFLEAQRYAADNGKGFWGTGFFGEQ